VFLVFGLGNPGKEYKDTRHNIGFQVIDEIAKTFRIPIKQYACKAVFGRLIRKVGEEIILIKPQTFMNLSGESIAECLTKFNCTPDNILIIHDDIDLPYGTVRLKNGGGSGGQKGIKSAIEKLGTGDFCRLKIGIGRPNDSENVVSYVLETFNCSERKDLPSIVQESIVTVLDFVDNGFHFAANRHNES
jgi:peptidyl-tRNA hydrolase, PTH1 family